MRKLIVPVLALFVLLPAGAALAQGPEMQPPGPTVQKSPGLTNNNLPNPNSADEQKAQPLNTQTTTPVDTTMQTTTMDEPVATTETTMDDSTTGTADDSTTLPATGSKLPLVGLVGLLALAGAVAVRRF